MGTCCSSPATPTWRDVGRSSRSHSRSGVPNMKSKPTNRADLIVLAVLVLLSGTYTLAQLDRAQETANRVRCASNLRQIGQAILLYSNENKGAYPRTVADFDKATP